MSLRAGVLLLLGLLSAVAHAAEQAERERIKGERAAIEATRVERESECQTRFAVTACVEDAQRAYRVALAELRRQQAMIDESERRQRASERVDRLANRAAKSIGPQPAPRAPRASEARAAAALPAASAAEAVPAKLPKPAKAQAQPRADSADKRAAEASRAAAFAARVREAEARRAAVERRNAERAQKGKASRPLPLPASAATP